MRMDDGQAAQDQQGQQDEPQGESLQYVENFVDPVFHAPVSFFGIATQQLVKNSLSAGKNQSFRPFLTAGKWPVCAQ